MGQEFKAKSSQFPVALCAHQHRLTPIFITFYLVLLSVFALCASANVIAQVSPSASITSMPTEIEADGEIHYQVVDVGVLAVRGDKVSINRWQPLMQWLESQIPHTYFRLHPLGLAELAKDVESQSLDFVITNPGQSVMLARQYSLSWLATLRHPLNQGSALQVGSALVVRSDSPYQTLRDLQGARLGIVSENAFGGYLTLVYEARLNDIDLPHFVGEIVPLGFPLDNLIYQLEGKVTRPALHAEQANVAESSIGQANIAADNAARIKLDAVVVPVCQLEQMQREHLIDIKDFRVLDNQAPADFNCQVSTRLYPNWSLAKTDRASQALAKSVTQVLLALPESHIAAKAADSAGWTTAVSQLAIDKLLQDLDLHPLQVPWWQSAWQWLSQHQQWAWLLLAVLVLLNVYHFWLEYRFSRRGRELTHTQRQLSENRLLLEHAQRIAIAGELGASLSHELNQPLAAIGHYCHGADIRLQRGTRPEELQSVIKLIQQEVTRADNIISRLRHLLKKRPMTKQALLLHDVVNNTVPLLAYEFERHHITLDVHITGEVYEQALDDVGMQQLLLNMLKNAMDACVQRQQAMQEHTQTQIKPKDYVPTVDILVEYGAHESRLSVTDNGAGLAEDPNILMQAFYTTKSEGLGLGLVICRDIAESHGGVFRLQSAPNGGCQAQVLIPKHANGAINEPRS